MGIPTLRNPNIVQPLAYRETLRQHLPTGSDGMVVEDLDLVLRWFGGNYALDDIGRIRLVEIKHQGFGIGRAQESTFGLIDRLCQVGAEAVRNQELVDRYDGFFVVQVDMNHVTPLELPSGRVVEVWADDIEVVVNGDIQQIMDKWQFIEWCNTPYSPIPPMTLDLPS